MTIGNNNSNNSSISVRVASPPPIPKEWPPEVVEAYEPVKVLGRGGFASVILARTKNTTTPAAQHAIKVVGGNATTTTGGIKNIKTCRQQLGYAWREIEILAELDHPNIMRLIQHWEPSPLSSSNSKSSNKCAAIVMALSYAEGQTLEKLLKLRGRLSVTCARVVAAQLVDAVAYLHGKAVVHRDIAPSNLIVSTRSAAGGGGEKDDDAIWEDAATATDGTAQDWETLRKKWHVTLVDFGFARALTPSDMKKGPPKLKSQNSFNASTGSAKLHRSSSMLLTRRMSAVGTRQYAAPEILNGIRDSIHSGGGGAAAPDDSSTFLHHPIDVTKTLSDHVSFYGLLADAYSTGNTIKHMLTGVSPEQDVEQVMALENHPIAVLCRFLCGGGNGQASTKHRVLRRSVRDIPPEAFRLIKGMTQFDPHQRTSVRTARLYPWIDDVLDEHASSSGGGGTSKPIEFLSFAISPPKQLLLSPPPPVHTPQRTIITATEQVVVHDKTKRNEAA